MEAEVVNESLTGSKTHIGRGKQVLRALVDAVGTAEQCTLQLFHANSTEESAQGTLTFTLLALPANRSEAAKRTAVDEAAAEKAALEAAEKAAAEKAAFVAAEKAAAEKEAEQSATKLQSRFRGYKLRKDALIIRIEKFVVQDLVDTGSFSNGQDPALSIKIGKKTFNTKRIKDAGTKAVFPEAFTFTVEAADLNADIEVST